MESAVTKTRCTAKRNTSTNSERACSASLEELLSTYKLIESMGRYDALWISFERNRIEQICKVKEWTRVGLKELNCILSLKDMIKLAKKEPNLTPLLDRLSGCYRVRSTNTYTVSTSSELDLLKIEFTAAARFTVASWMYIAFSTHFEDGVELGWSTIDAIFEYQSLPSTHPDTWTMDNFLYI